MCLNWIIAWINSIYYKYILSHPLSLSRCLSRFWSLSLSLFVSISLTLCGIKALGKEVALTCIRLSALQECRWYLVEGFIRSPLTLAVYDFAHSPPARKWFSLQSRWVPKLFLLPLRYFRYKTYFYNKIRTWWGFRSILLALWIFWR